MVWITGAAYRVSELRTWIPPHVPDERRSTPMNIPVKKKLRTAETVFLLEDGQAVALDGYEDEGSFLADLIRVQVDEENHFTVSAHQVDDPDGHWRYLTDEEDKEVLDALGLEYIEEDDEDGDQVLRLTSYDARRRVP